MEDQQSEEELPDWWGALSEEQRKDIRGWLANLAAGGKKPVNQVFDSLRGLSVSSPSSYTLSISGMRSRGVRARGSIRDRNK
jgi:hypothetical protein